MPQTTIADIARLIGGELVGSASVQLRGCAGLKEAKVGDVSFLANSKYEPLAKESKASVIIVPLNTILPGKNIIRVELPSLAFSKAITYFSSDLSKPLEGVHPTAIIAKDAHIGKNVAIGPFVTIESKAHVADGTKIHAYCYIGHEVIIGSNSILYPRVTLYERVSLGQRTIIHSGTVIGPDGYGYVTVEGKHVKIPQMGTVIIEDDVEIGANVTIDRARFDKTIIGEGTKIDNLVHIAHNVTIGKHCLIVAQVGVSGSTDIGNHVILAGQAGIVGHLTIGDGAVVAAQSGVSKSIKAGQQVFGTPAQPIRDAFRNNAHIQRLDHYVQTIQDLKKRIEDLEKKDATND